MSVITSNFLAFFIQRLRDVISFEPLYAYVELADSLSSTKIMARPII